MKKIIALLTITLFIGYSGNAQKDNKKGAESKSKAEKPISASGKMVLISTSMGDMKVRLYDATPLHRDNFLKLVEQNYYDSLLFHRVIRNFMIQGGDPLSKNAQPNIPLGMGDIGYTIPAEFIDTIFHKKGALCAARTENPAKASSGCQFYIVQGQVLTPEQLHSLEMQRGLKLTDEQKKIYSTVGGSPWLDGAYTVYGEVIEGLDIIDKIAAVETNPSAGDRPKQNVYILKMTLFP